MGPVRVLPILANTLAERMMHKWSSACAAMEPIPWPSSLQNYLKSGVQSNYLKEVTMPYLYGAVVGNQA